MSSIVTITLNPAIDKSTTVTELVQDKKMKCSPPLFEPGGGGVNVARAIKKLGGNAIAVYLAGGYTGNFFSHLLEEEGIATKEVLIAQHTRENLIVLDKNGNKQYRFGMPGPAISSKEWQQLLLVIEKMDSISFLVASGSIPAGVPADIFARIGSIAKKKNAKYIVDTSGEALIHAVDKGVYLLKPNLAELSSLAGKEWIDDKEAEQTAKEIIRKESCEVIVVSMGEKGAMLVTKNEVHRIKAPLVERKSTVGAGDCMVAGIVLSLSNKKDLLQAVQYGVACGTAATMNPGTELCKSEDVEKIYTDIIET